MVTFLCVLLVLGCVGFSLVKLSAKMSGATGTGLLGWVGKLMKK